MNKKQREWIDANTAKEEENLREVIEEIGGEFWGPDDEEQMEAWREIMRG